MHGVRSSSDQVTSTFWRQILQTVRTYSSRFVFLISRPTLSITVTETVVKAQRSLRWEIETMEVESKVTGVKPSSFKHVVLRQNCLLSLLSYLWHYNRHFAFTRDNRTHPTPNRREDVWRQKLVVTINAFSTYGKMAAVSVVRMRTGSYAYIIALINFGIL